MELTEKQMYQIEGGASFGVLAGIAAAVVFVIGFFNGYTNPNKCSN